MNIFRLIGDLLHALSIILLLWKLRKSRSCIGISCKMQEMYLIVFVTRYLDLLWRFVSIYNTIMKILFITTTAYLIHLMRFQFPISQTYDAKADSLPYQYYLVIPCIIISLFTTQQYRIQELLWTFSIWLESVAIMPQLMLLQALGEIENLTSHYVAAMGAYRFFYILNWIYRYKTEQVVNWVVWVAGALQVALYLDFFYYYIKSRLSRRNFVLPYFKVDQAD